MWTRIVVIISAYEALVFGLFQADIMPDGVIARILEQYPPLAVVLVVVYWMRKTQREDAKETNERLEKMLEIQRKSIKETYESQQTFLNTLLTQMESKQQNMSNRIELLTQQVAVNTSTVGEVAKVDSIVSDLIARLEKK